MNEVTTYEPQSQFSPSPETARIGDVETSPPREASAIGDSATGISATGGSMAGVSVQSDSAAWLFPGLGCRYVGMGYDLIGRFATADNLISAAQSRLAFNIIEVCLEGSGRKYVPARQEAQVIYVLDCAYAAVLRERGCNPRIIAGHSLGNLAACFAAGAYDFLTGLELVTRVEDLMEELIDGRDQAMGVVIGLDDRAIRDLLQAVPGTFLANWNSPLQYVVGGFATDVDRVLRMALECGAKQAKRFITERAIHTPLMADVAARFSETLATVNWNDLRTPLVNSQTATVLRTAAEIRHFLGGFLSQPVHWQATVQAILSGWGRQFVEVGPGNLLTSMLPFIESTATARTASDVLDQKVQL
ncbi:MAG: malonyl CoA-acyl carrier protein transacylase [Planctomycetaceae bacterium]|nr:malonyl CoA-acyl carrier protein transacylase [Planctomycetaceae bacterium]